MLDEDTNYHTSTSTPAAFQAPSPQVQAPTPIVQATPPEDQAPLSSTSHLGPVTRARARELNYIMLLKNEGPEA